MSTRFLKQTILHLNYCINMWSIVHLIEVNQSEFACSTLTHIELLKQSIIVQICSDAFHSAEIFLIFDCRFLIKFNWHFRVRLLISLDNIILVQHLSQSRLGSMRLFFLSDFYFSVFIVDNEPFTTIFSESNQSLPDNIFSSLCFASGSKVFLILFCKIIVVIERIKMFSWQIGLKQISSCFRLLASITLSVLVAYPNDVWLATIHDVGNLFTWELED